MTPYRAPAERPEIPRERPRRVVLRDADFYGAVLIAAALLACAVWAAGCAYGTKITCDRSREAECVARGLFGRDAFGAVLGAVVVREESDEGKTQHVFVAGRREQRD